jgi:tetratricopeptide (TPR) repeat protein
MSIGPDPKQDNKRKPSRFYFGLGYGFLFIMALLSSVDSSIVYILLGAATFCIFLGFYNRPSAPKMHGWTSPKRPQQQARSQSTSATAILLQLINMIRQQQSGRTSASSSTKGRKSIIAFIPALVIIFMVIVVISMITSDNDNGEASSYFYTAQTYSDAGQYDSAQLYFRKALRTDPEYNDAKVGNGKVFLLKNQLDSALYFFDQVIADDPDNVDAVYNKGVVYSEQGKYREGIELIAPLVEANPQHYDAMLLMGDYYYLQKQYSDALPWYNTAYTDGGMRSRMLCHIMAFIYDNDKQFDKAIPLYKEALSYDSTVVDIHQRLGELIPGEEGNYYRAKGRR